MKPHVGISQCLVGGRVRYDGGHKLERPLVEALAFVVEWVEVCPEVEVGMGVPREPVRLVRAIPHGSTPIRMIAAQSGRDWTDRMDAWARGKLGELASMRLSGYVLKARSPSCGLHDVPIHTAGPDARPSGRGMFAAALASAFPDLPMDDEERLRDPAASRAFIHRVLAFHRSHWETG